MAIPLAPWQIQAIVKARQIPESRRGSSVCTSQSVQEAVPEPPWCFTNSLTASRPHLFSLKSHNQSPCHLKIKTQECSLPTPPLPLNSLTQAVDITADAVLTSNKVNSKNLERLCGKCKGELQDP